MALTQSQERVLKTLLDHLKREGTAGIGTIELDREMHRLFGGSHYGYDALHSVLVRLHRRALVYRSDGRPARWKITLEGRAALSGEPDA